jgi:hypothetical protein
MRTKTTTKVAHYYVQKQRRAEFIETWRANQRTVVALEDVPMHETSELDLPDGAARAKIVASALADLAQAWPALGDLARDAALHEDVARATRGWDGRRLRKLPLAVLGSDPELARDPARLTAGRLRAAATGAPAASRSIIGITILPTSLWRVHGQRRPCLGQPREEVRQGERLSLRALGRG